VQALEGAVFHHQLLLVLLEMDPDLRNGYRGIDNEDIVGDGVEVARPSAVVDSRLHRTEAKDQNPNVARLEDLDVEGLTDATASVQRCKALTLVFSST
jgi:hypothetical protein